MAITWIEVKKDFESDTILIFTKHGNKFSASKSDRLNEVFDLKGIYNSTY